MLNRLRWLWLLFTGLLLFTLPAYAQTPEPDTAAVQAELISPETEAFPRMTAFLDVHDSEGRFVHGLESGDVRILENGRTLPVLDISALRPGAQMVFAINPGPTFAIRDSQGVSRYDLVVAALRSWASSRQGSTIDDLSLLAASGPERTHLAGLDDWLASLESYQPDSRAIAPTLDLLTRALVVAADPPPRPGMERAVLFITAPIGGDLSFAVQNLAAQAKEQRVHIFVWYVASTEAFTTPAATQLQELAEETGGRFFPYSGTETLPGIEEYLEPLRDIYHLIYDSQIAGGGVHQVGAEIVVDGAMLQTELQQFEFDLQPPDPAFIAPALQIQREFPGEGRKNLLEGIDLNKLSPQEQELRVLIDFPDGHPRPIVKTILYVDGVVVDTNTEPPFDVFTWDLREYTTSGEHVLRIEVQDNMGMTGTSIEMLFEVGVDQPSFRPLAFLVRYWPAVGGLLALLAGAMVFLGLILSGRIRPHLGRLPGELRRGRRQRKASAPPPAQFGADKSQPEPQPAGLGQAEAGEGRLTGWVNRLHWPQRRLAPTAFAYLTRVSTSDPGSDTAVPIPITADEITLGCDPLQATLVLEDLSVAPLHARLLHREDGSFWISDQGSVAGTWINYTPVPAEGAPVEHGDLMHLGRIGFRFTRRDPQRMRRPVVTEPPA
jgi:hypothetical protein